MLKIVMKFINFENEEVYILENEKDCDDVYELTIGQLPYVNTIVRKVDTETIWDWIENMNYEFSIYTNELTTLRDFILENREDLNIDVEKLISKIEYFK